MWFLLSTVLKSQWISLRREFKTNDFCSANFASVTMFCSRSCWNSFSSASYLNVIRLPGESLVGCPLLLEGVLGGVGEYGGRNKTSALHFVNHFNNAICMVYRSIIQYNNNAVRVHTGHWKAWDVAGGHFAEHHKINHHLLYPLLLCNPICP